jgi:hypothetical protein
VPIPQDVEQERHDARITKPLDSPQRVQLGANRSRRPYPVGCDTALGLVHARSSVTPRRRIAKASRSHLAACQGWARPAGQVRVLRSSAAMLDEATRQVRARLAFVAQENVLHEQLAALNADLSRARHQRLSADQWEAALPNLIKLCDAVVVCRERFHELAAPASMSADQPRAS